MGTDAADAADALRLRIRMSPDGRAVVCFRGESTDRTGYNGVQRFYYLDILTNLLTHTWRCIGTLTNTTERMINFTNEAPDVASAFFRVRPMLDLPFPPIANAGPDLTSTDTTVTLGRIGFERSEWGPR